MESDNSIDVCETEGCERRLHGWDAWCPSCSRIKRQREIEQAYAGKRLAKRRERLERAVLSLMPRQCEVDPDFQEAHNQNAIDLAESVIKSIDNHLAKSKPTKP